MNITELDDLEDLDQKLTILVHKQEKNIVDSSILDSLENLEEHLEYVVRTWSVEK